jgi:hypothetical protein
MDVAVVALPWPILPWVAIEATRAAEDRGNALEGR